ncbi:MAG: universal stress protein [Deltaproteobacteria bacterium]|nr:universal stress protein [Deltaproteobacteria bacterium]
MDLSAILVATDFSECSCAAFQAAKKLAQAFGAKVVLLHVINQTVMERLAEHMNVELEALLPELREKAQQQLSGFLKKCATEAREVESMVALGIPFQEIAVIARELAVDLVVLGGYGRRGRGPIDEVFFGSTAEKVVRLLPCPVLCVPLGG